MANNNRKVTVHESAFCRLTERAQLWTQVLNNYMRNFPTTSLKDLAEHFGLSYTNARRYYYGIHQKNDFDLGNYSQVRYGVKVDI
jgi:hypothetical protein